MNKSLKTGRLTEPDSTDLSKNLLLLMATGCGLSVANLYYNQPLLADMAQTFHVTAREMGNISMLTQIGYAAGLFMFVPLGDIKERRRLITTLLGLVAIALISVGAAPNLTALGIASFILGATTVVPQLIVPYAAQLAGPGNQGKAVGIVMSGLFFGILLARTISGYIGDIYGWRTMFFLASALMILLLIILKFKLPQGKPSVSKFTYPQLLRSTWQLVLEQPLLREASLMGSMLFGAFSVFWTTLAFFIKEPPYHYGTEIAGLFGLVGVVGATFAPLAGRLADRKNPRFTAGMAALITLAAYIIFGLWGYRLWGLIAGVILLDLGVQSAQISNQTRIYGLLPEAKNRLNTVYMVTYFLGGSIGSLIGSYFWSLWQWNGVCTAGSALVLLSLAIWAAGYQRENNFL